MSGLWKKLNIFLVQGIRAQVIRVVILNLRVFLRKKQIKKASLIILQLPTWIETQVLVDRLNESWKNTDQFESIQDYKAPNQFKFTRTWQFTLLITIKNLFHMKDMLSPEQVK